MKITFKNITHVFAPASTGLAAIVLSVALAHAGLRTGAEFLNLPSGARSMGLGVMAASMADDVDLVNSNPAAIASLSASGNRFGSFSLAHQTLFLNSNVTQLGAAVPFGRSSSMGLSLVRLSYADSEGRAADRSATGSVGASDTAVGLILAHGFGPMQLGTQVKMIHQQLDSQTSQGVAADIGLVSETPLSRLTLGVAARNIGPNMRFIEESYSLPLSLSVGAMYQLASGFSLGTGIQSLPRRNEVAWGIGSELKIAQSFSFRTGYLAQVKNSSPGESPLTDGITGGFGLLINQFRLDYAVQPFGDLGSFHSFTLTAHYGMNRSIPQPPEPSNNKLQLDLNPDGKFFP